MIVKELAAWLGAQWEGNGECDVRRVASLDDAGPEDLSFVTRGKALKQAGASQAACLVVLAAYDIGAGPALAYGIILQAVELLTALALGVPALLREGMTWQDIRRGHSGTVSIDE